MMLDSREYPSILIPCSGRWKNWDQIWYARNECGLNIALKRADHKVWERWWPIGRESDNCYDSAWAANTNPDCWHAETVLLERQGNGCNGCNSAIKNSNDVT